MSRCLALSPALTGVVLGLRPLSGLRHATLRYATPALRHTFFCHAFFCHPVLCHAMLLPSCATPHCASLLSALPQFFAVQCCFLQGFFPALCTGRRCWGV